MSTWTRLALLACGLGLAAGAWFMPEGRVASAPASTAPPRGPAYGATLPADPAPRSHARPEPVRVFRQGYARRTSAVASTCGLALQPTCQGGTCVALLVMPDMDHVGGWVQVGFGSPTFVASTALRDLGVPSRHLPCGRAVEALTARGGIEAVELPDGTEVWCTLDDTDTRPGWRERALALCSALAARQVPGARFEGRLRPLDFAIPSEAAVEHGVTRRASR